MNEFDTKDSSNLTEQSQTIEKSSGNLFQSKRTGLWILIGILVLAGVFRMGYNSGKSGYVFSPTEFKIVNQSSQSGEVDYGLLWQAIDVVKSKYIERDSIDQKKVLYGAINGAVRAMGDEYTEFFDPETLAEFKTELQGSFSGIGAEIGKRNGNIVVIAPLDDSPASRAGLLPQDIILSVNGEAAAEKNVDQAVRLIRGEQGTEVTLSIFREGRTTPFDIKIIRDKIEIKSVKLEFKQSAGKEVAVLTVSRFGDDTKRLFDQAVKDIQARGVDGLVLDLRSNPGGYLETSVELASDWLSTGTLIVTEARSEQDSLEFKSDGVNRLGGIKTKVLINGGSASAAEILAGALKDAGVADLIGEKSFGKGSVQELIPIGKDSAVKVTIAKWITPSGQNLNKEGLKPDIEVERTEDDYLNKRDPQLDRAIEELLK